MIWFNTKFYSILFYSILFYSILFYQYINWQLNIGQRLSTWYPTQPSAVYTHGHVGQLPGAHEHRGAMLIYVCCVQHVFDV